MLSQCMKMFQKWLQCRVVMFQLISVILPITGRNNLKKATIKEICGWLCELYGICFHLSWSPTQPPLDRYVSTCQAMW